jgi:hypothetical protein
MPSPVRDVHVENLLSGRRFLIDWVLNDDVEGVTVYKIYRSSNQFSDFQLLTTINAPTSQYIDKVPFTFGIIFYYKVVAVNSSGLSSDFTLAEPVSDVTFDQFEEAPFQATTVAFTSFVYNETPGGLLNNSNLIYQTAYLYRLGTTQLFKNGSLLKPTIDYAENNDQQSITMTVAPLSTDSLRIHYTKV